MPKCCIIVHKYKHIDIKQSKFNDHFVDVDAVDRAMLDARFSHLYFLSIFTLSSSAVIPSEKSPINTNGKSTTRFPMSLR